LAARIADCYRLGLSAADAGRAFGGRILIGVTEVEYTEKREKDLLYGRGCKPHGIVSGNRSYEGKISLWQSELEAMTRDALSNDILGLSFDLVWNGKCSQPSGCCRRQ